MLNPIWVERIWPNETNISKTRLRINPPKNPINTWKINCEILNVYIDEYKEKNKDALEIDTSAHIPISQLSDLRTALAIQKLDEDKEDKEVPLKKVIKNQILNCVFPYLKLKI